MIIRRPWQPVPCPAGKPFPIIWSAFTGCHISTLLCRYMKKNAWKPRTGWIVGDGPEKNQAGFMAW